MVQRAVRFAHQTFGKGQKMIWVGSYWLQRPALGHGLGNISMGITVGSLFTYPFSLFAVLSRCFRKCAESMTES